MVYFAVLAVYALTICAFSASLSWKVYSKGEVSTFVEQKLYESMVLPSMIGSVFATVMISPWGILCFPVIWGLAILFINIGKRRSLRTLHRTMYMKKNARLQLDAQYPWRDWQPHDPSKSAH